MYAASEARGGVLEPNGAAEIKFRYVRVLTRVTNKLRDARACVCGETHATVYMCSSKAHTQRTTNHYREKDYVAAAHRLDAKLRTLDQELKAALEKGTF